MSTNVADDRVSLSELKNWVRTFAEERGWITVHNPKDLAIGLVTEACELLELFRFRDADEIRALLGEADSREDIADELADALYCLLRFADLNGFDLAEALKRKLVKTALKYPATTDRAPGAAR